MYRIAICDDEKSSAVRAAELLDAYKKQHGSLETSVDSFYSSLELLEAIEKEPYDIYLLDIYIDKMNGIEIAEAIRKRDQNGQIIFMTSSNAFYKEAFRIHAAHYLEKPILEDEFFDAMDRVCTDEDVRYISIKDSGEMIKVPVESICYIQSEDHYKRVVTVDRSYLVRSTLQQLLDDIDSDAFCALGVKHIINLKKVLKITKDSLTMEDGTEFPVPRGTYRSLSEKILKYAF